MLRRMLAALYYVAFAGTAWSAASVTALYLSSEVPQMLVVGAATAPLVTSGLGACYCIVRPPTRWPVVEACVGGVSALAGWWVRVRAPVAGLEVCDSVLLVGGIVILACALATAARPEWDPGDIHDG